MEIINIKMPPFLPVMFLVVFARSSGTGSGVPGVPGWRLRWQVWVDAVGRCSAATAPFHSSVCYSLGCHCLLRIAFRLAFRLSWAVWRPPGGGGGSFANRESFRAFLCLLCRRQPTLFVSLAGGWQGNFEYLTQTLNRFPLLSPFQVAAVSRIGPCPPRRRRSRPAPSQTVGFFQGVVVCRCHSRFRPDWPPNFPLVLCFVGPRQPPFCGVVCGLSPAVRVGRAQEVLFTGMLIVPTRLFSCRRPQFGTPTVPEFDSASKSLT
ncbi:hypothetical protein B0T18DRAFT_64120 [Schizothecium vesticola]|uniref:Secreted protein n=1 Tax=Schizothecium vesticola TaxID=314040 RepID=A0AA40K9X8_9PEZI|nr:hypothetical protein B0T18DRAFT_64120 [Schizothecium vesticola]